MDKKFGFYATTSMLALAALSGSAAFHANAADAKDAYFTPEFSLEQAAACGAADAPCDPAEFALLNAPNNVIYKTRATVAPPVADDTAADLTDQPASRTQGALIPSNDKEPTD
jgi:hypothetical protein